MSLTNREFALKYFGTELNTITSPELREWVLECFDKLMPPYFRERAASKSGRYHPKCTRNKGGLVAHTILIAKMARDFARAFFPSKVQFGQEADLFYSDVLVAAALLHDLVKDGDPAREHLNRDNREILGCHGIDMADAIVGRITPVERLNRQQTLVLYAIATHMGIWTSDPHFRPMDQVDPEVQKVCIWLHASDYAMSRPLDLWLEEVSQRTADLAA